MDCILQGQIKGANKELSNLSNYQKALHNIGGRSSRNLLDNWYFVGGGSQQGGGQFPINQRGKTSYASVNVIDRWHLSGNGGQSLTIDTDGITLTSTAQYGTYLNQKLDQSIVGFCKGKSVTFSAFSTGQNTAKLSLSIYINGEWKDYVDIQEGLSTKQFVIPTTANSIYFSFGSNSAGTCKIIATKLELGPTQTLAYQDEDGNWQLFETPDYGEELAQCQRYLIVETAENEKPGTAYSNTSGVFTISTAVQMRTTPVLKELKGYEPKIALSDGSTVLITKEEITVLGADVSGVRIRVDVTGDKTLKLGPASIRDCNMVLSAEL